MNLKTRLRCHLLFVVALLNASIAVGGDVRLLIEPETAVFAAGEPVALTLSVTNETERQVVLWRSSFGQNHRIVIHNASGALTAPTELGEKIIRAFAPFGQRTANIPFGLPPGEKRPWESLNLRELFQLTPGIYYVKVLYEDPQCTGFTGLICSSEVVLTVLE